MATLTIDESEIVWSVFRLAVNRFSLSASTDDDETEAMFRKRAEKAGLEAVAKFIRDNMSDPS